MAIPNELQAEIDHALDAIKQHSGHEYGPKQRQKLFRLFKSDASWMRVWRWLAIFTAAQVLPIYQRYIAETGRTFVYYDVQRPAKALVMARDILTGKLEPSIGYDTANGSYDPHDFDYGWRARKPVPFNVYQSGRAANIALLEASKDNLDPFAGLPHIAYWNNGFCTGRDIGYQIAQEIPDAVAGEHFTDALWSISGHSDTAAVASTAWACTETLPIPDPAKLLEFWLWWFIEAIPEAWNTVELS